MVAEPAAKVTRIEEGRATYRTADGQEKYAKFFLSLAERLHGSTVAEWEIAVHVLVSTRFDGLPKRISVRQFMDVCHLANHAVQEGLWRLKNRGLLYEEREPDSQSIRYALVDAANPSRDGFAPFTQEDGSLAIILLGGLCYQIPDTVSFWDTVKSVYRTRKGYSTVPPKGTPRTRKGYSTVPPKGTVPPRQPRQQQARRGPRDSLESITETSLETPGAVSDETRTPTPPVSSDSQTQDDAESAAWLSEEPAPAPSESSQNTKPAAAKKQRPPNPAYERWKELSPYQPVSEREIGSICVGLAKLMNTEETHGAPVTLEELPALMAQVQTWKDKNGDPYLPMPWIILEFLGKLRYQVKHPSKGEKGTTHAGTNGHGPAGLAGTGGANHEGDSAILAGLERARVARARQEAAARAATGYDAGQ